MSQQAPVLCISDGDTAWSKALGAIETFPLIETTWDEALDGIDSVGPAAVLATCCNVAGDRLAAVASRVAMLEPYVPLIAVDAAASQHSSVTIPFSFGKADCGRLEARLNAALRVRTLHATVLRRIAGDGASIELSTADPMNDATVLLIGRGASYPTLSIALGERMDVVGALSIEAAAKHLNARDLDGIVIGEGFSPRVVEAFLTVLSEDPRFRNLPVTLTGQAAAFVTAPNLPNLDIATAAEVAARAVPLIRQHAFEAGLGRALNALDAGGLLDVRTGLLTPAAFDRNLGKAIDDTQERGGGLSVARFAFDMAQERTRFDAARILGRLMRRMDFASLQDEGSVLVAFAETDLRTAHIITRRLASVLRHTLHCQDRNKRVEPQVTLVTLRAKDTSETLRERLFGENQRAAS